MVAREPWKISGSVTDRKRVYMFIMVIVSDIFPVFMIV
jgi:hypothetical protein